jgi:RNA polymerase sigma factor (sigma-70 family)
VNDLSDHQLLCEYLEHRSEAAFGEVLRRHIDLVYSAALRMVCDPHLAEDVTQSTFVALAQNASQLTTHPVLSGWLHCTTRNLAAKCVRAEVRRRAHEQEAAAMNQLLANEPEALWKNIAPHLDDAIAELADADRDALLLRYFERKSAREMGQIFGTSEEAAQKRVSRAVERLREFFSQRGVTVGVGGLVVLISANAVQAAPLALPVSISAVLAGTSVNSSTAIITIKASVMTTLQKTAIAVALATAIGTGVYQTERASHLRSRLQLLEQEKQFLADQLRQLQDERDKMNSDLSSLRNENDHWKHTQSETLELRSEVARLRKDNQQLASAQQRTNQATENQTGSYDSSNDIQLPKSSWTNAGFATPENALRTRGWAILNGDREQFKNSLALTDGARKLIEDMILKMAAASKDPSKTAAMQEAVNNGWGAEEAILMPLMAMNRNNNFTGYRIISEQSPSDDERILQVETQTAAAPAQNQTLKFIRIGNDWKVSIDENLVQSAR